MNPTQSSNKACYNCSKVGHLARDCKSEPKNEEKGQSRRAENRNRGGGGSMKKCHNCSEVGHLERDCTFLVRNDRDGRNDRDTSERYNSKEDSRRREDTKDGKAKKARKAKSKQPKKVKRCFNCDEEDHLAADCAVEKKNDAKSKQPKKAKRCFNCDVEGHIAIDCAIEKKYDAKETKPKPQKKAGDQTAKPTKAKKEKKEDVYVKKSTRLIDQAEALIKKFEMEANPAGGWHKEVFRNEHMSTAYNLLKEGDVSLWHSVSVDQILHYYRGSELEIEVSDEKGEDVELVYIGSNFENGQHIQYTVPGGRYFSMRPLGVYTMFGSNFAPAFASEHLKMAEKEWKPTNSDLAVKRSKKVVR